MDCTLSFILKRNFTKRRYLFLIVCFGIGSGTYLRADEPTLAVTPSASSSSVSQIFTAESPEIKSLKEAQKIDRKDFRHAQRQESRNLRSQQSGRLAAFETEQRKLAEPERVATSGKKSVLLEMILQERRELIREQDAKLRDFNQNQSDELRRLREKHGP